MIQRLKLNLMNLNLTVIGIMSLTLNQYLNIVRTVIIQNGFGLKVNIRWQKMKMIPIQNYIQRK